MTTTKIPQPVPTFRRVTRGWCRYGADHHAVHVTGRDDHSPVHRMWPTGYAPECSWCWLGYTHSEWMHAERLSR